MQPDGDIPTGIRGVYCLITSCKHIHTIRTFTYIKILPDSLLTTIAPVDTFLVRRHG